MKVSIITPVYKAIDFIDETILSVVNQTYKDWELIIIDDCSGDGTFEYIKERYDHEPRIRVFSTPKNSGAGIARNLGLDSATSDLIAFLDADDIWDKNKLSIQVDFMLSRNIPISHTSYSFINEGGSKISGNITASDCIDLVKYLKSTEIGMSTSMINKSIVGDFSISSIRNRQDTKLWINLLSRGFNSYGIDEQLVSYRIRNGQISKNKFKMLLITFVVYRNVSVLPLTHRYFYFMCYIFNAIRKRTK